MPSDATRDHAVEAFLKHAHKKHSAKHITFNVIVVEASPHLGGHEMALSLSDDGIPTTVIPGLWLPHMRKEGMDK